MAIKMRRHVVVGGLGMLATVGVVVALAALTTAPAPAAQRMILAEQFTATWCVYCPTSSRALHRMMTEYPTTFTWVQIHGADAYEIPWGVTRRSFYAPFDGYPTVWLDGLYRHVGAQSSDEATYNWYKGSYLTRMGVPTDVWIQVGAVPLGGQTYRVTARIGLEPGQATQRSLRIHMVHVLDHYPASSDFRYRNCLRLPSVPSVDITVQANSYQEVSQDFTFDAVSWANQSNIKIIVWAQTIRSTGPAGVFNAGQLFWPFSPLPPVYSRGDLNCDGAVNTFDIDPFVLALTNPSGYQQQYPNCDVNLADCNQDGQVNAFDIDAFVQLITP